MAFWKAFVARHYLIILYLVSSCYGVFEFHSNIDINEGQKQYRILVQETKHPSYGACWKNAMIKLHADCAHLTATSQSRLAFKFFNCFLETSGLKSYSCAEDAPLNDCFSKMVDRDFASYTGFFTHTQNMCFFLKNEQWRDETESTIIKLIDTSSHISSQLRDQFHLQEMMLKSQKESLQNEQKMLNHGKEVNEALAISKSAAVELFHHLVNFRATVFGELAGLYTLIFYFFSLAISYLLTTAKRTKSSRFWLFLIFTITFTFEKIFISWNAVNLFSKSESKVQEAIFHDDIWLLRKLSITLAAAVLLICSFNYHDLNKVNNQLLQETRLLLKEIYEKNHLSSLQKDATGKEVNLLAKKEDGNNLLYSEDYDELGYTRPRQHGTVLSSDDESFTTTPIKKRTFRNGRSFARHHKPSVERHPCPYNLRDRSKLSSPEMANANETPEVFGDLVHYLALTARKRSLQLQQTSK